MYFFCQWNTRDCHDQSNSHSKWCWCATTLVFIEIWEAHKKQTEIGYGGIAVWHPCMILWYHFTRKYLLYHSCPRSRPVRSVRMLEDLISLIRYSGWEILFEIRWNHGERSRPRTGAYIYISQLISIFFEEHRILVEREGIGIIYDLISASSPLDPSPLRLLLPPNFLTGSRGREDLMDR